MKALLEVTKWSSKIPNHTYLVNDNKEKLYAYIKVGTKDVVELAKPIKFDTRGRKFKEVPNYSGYLPQEDIIPVSTEWKVTGSKGDVYTVKEEQGNYSCTCTGFVYRGKCKHIESVK